MAQAFRCIIPDAVYHEVVTRGKGRLYSDAEEIETIAKEAITVQPTGTLEMPGAGLGTGEMAVLALSTQQHEEVIIVSDDRQFLALLARQRAPFTTPSDLIAAMARHGALTTKEAKRALERLRPLIRETAYHKAIQDLEG